MSAPERTEVLVVGAGAAGLAAALAARAADRQVVLLDGGDGRTALLAGMCGPLHRPEALPPGAGPEALAAALEALGSSPLAWQRADDPARPLLAALEAGVAGEALALAPEVLDLTSLPEGTAVGVVALEGLEPSLPGFLARSLAEQPSLRARGLRFERLAVAPGFGEATGSSPYHLAEALTCSEAAVDKLAAALLDVAKAAGSGALLLPPVLGLGPEPAVLERLRAAVGMPLGEWYAPLEPVRGERWRRRMRAALRTRGVVRRPGRLARLERRGERLRAELTEGEAIEAAVVVLATGRYVAGGLHWGRQGPAEPLLGLPVGLEGRPIPLSGHPQGPDPLEVLGAEWPCRGEGWRWGLLVDEALRPLGEDGTPFDPRLHAAGDLLAGHDPADGGLAAALATGWRAGQLAARLEADAP